MNEILLAALYTHDVSHYYLPAAGASLNVAIKLS